MSITLNRVRGDNYPLYAIIKVNGDPIDLASSTVTFSYSNSDNPKRSIHGNIIPDKIGEVIFYPTSDDFQVSGIFKFDIQREVAGIVSTHMLGTLILNDDITA